MRDMNPQADPCQDFSQYTCGGFIEREEIPADQDAVGYFHIIRDQNNRVIRSIVTPGSGNLNAQSGEDGPSQRNIKKMQDLYASCMNEDEITRIGRQPVVDEVQKLLDVFNIPNSALASSSFTQEGSSPTIIDKDTLSKTLAYLSRMGFESFNSFDVSADAKDPLRNVLELSEGGLGLPSKEYYLDDRIMGIYESTIGKMFNLILGEESKEGSTDSLTDALPEKWARIAKNVVEFEKQLAAISTDVNDLNSSEKTYNPSTIDQISSMTPSVDWSMVLQNILPVNTSIPQSIIVISPPFQERLESLLQETSPQTFQNYLTWSVIRQLSGNLALHWKQPLRELNAALTGVSATAVPERWKTCVSVINRQLGEIAGHYFVNEQFKGNSRNQVHDMIETLRETYIKAFPNLDWLDEDTSAGAVKKMEAIVQLIGFSTDSPNVASPESLDEYYSEYKVDSKDFFGNQRRVGLWNTEKMFKELNSPVNRLKMHMVPQTVNAYYSPSENQIVFPAGILQAPFFHTENPEYINYGGIGVVAGHEITHGFDNRGHLFDAVGRMDNWWTNTTSEAFKNKANCFVEQYGNFSVKGSDGKDYFVNGQLTLGENIADNGGLKQSFDSWQTRYQSDKQGRNIQRPESAIRQMRTDPHSPAKWRINGAVQNSVAFAKAFNCPSGSAMNPEKKCDLW
ncbi:Endothelin-converting enzyme 2 [Mortierella sp. AM989]|nr:Endothelin-converting enzyme 2 [Mortierella sp. AM989]